MSSSNTSRSLDLVRREGFIATVVEHWIPKIMKRRDLFGFGDILAVHHKLKRTLIIQTTSIENVGARLSKARKLPQLRVWLMAGNEFEVHGWTNHDAPQVKRIRVGIDELHDCFLAVPKRRRKKNLEQAAVDLFAIAK